MEGINLDSLIIEGQGYKLFIFCCFINGAKDNIKESQNICIRKYSSDYFDQSSLINMLLNSGIAC